MKTVRSVITFVLLGILVWGCGSESAQDKNAATPDPVVSVKIAPIQRKTMQVTITVDGFTDVLDRERVIAPVDGTVVSLEAEVGASLKAGDTVAVLRTRDSEASLAGANRLMEQAKTPEQREEAKRALEVALETQQLVPVIVGRRGVVVAKMASAGQTVSADAELFELVDLSTLNFIASIPLQDLTRIKIGQSGRITFPSLPDRNFNGQVTAVSAQSDQGSQAAPVRLRFTDPAPTVEKVLRVGMMGTAVITVGEHPDVLVVPSAALLRDDLADTYTVFTVGPDSLARQVPVTVGVMTDSLSEISAPLLHEGDPVIVDGNYEVSDSTRVTVTAGDQL
jgi:RND family efflux transporter MFP subunit